MITTKNLITSVTLSLSLCALLFSGASFAAEESSVGTTASVGFSGTYTEKEPPAINPDDGDDSPKSDTGDSGFNKRPGSNGNSDGRSQSSGTHSRPNNQYDGATNGRSNSSSPAGSSNSNGTILPKLGNISQTIYSSYGTILMGIMSILIYKENKNEKEIL